MLGNLTELLTTGLGLILSLSDLQYVLPVSNGFWKRKRLVHYLSSCSVCKCDFIYCLQCKISKSI